MLDDQTDVLIFWRAKDRAPFTYAGLGHAAEVEDTTPVRVLWAFEPEPQGSRMAADGSAEPSAFRRGPRPTAGQRNTVVVDGAASVYLMVLKGDYAGLFTEDSAGTVVIKVGMSNDPARRQHELNSGFPPGSSISWVLLAAKKHDSLDDAFEAESALLEVLRQRRYWIGGEFAALPDAELSSVLALVND